MLEFLNNTDKVHKKFYRNKKFYFFYFHLFIIFIFLLRDYSI